MLWYVAPSTITPTTGVYEVGVHIADVSYFVQPGTPLDEMASRRATSVYLVQKVCNNHKSSISCSNI